MIKQSDRQEPLEHYSDWAIVQDGTRRLRSRDMKTSLIKLNIFASLLSLLFCGLGDLLQRCQIGHVTFSEYTH